MRLLTTVLFAMSLCADCFAVTTCSSLGIKNIKWTKTLYVAIVFAIVQAGLLATGWSLADLFVGYLGKIAEILAMLLLFYVGGSMIVSALKKDSESLELNSLRNVLIGAVASSIDAFTVGVSLSFSHAGGEDVAIKTLAVFICTFLSVVLGMKLGSSIGMRFGKKAELLGGIVLVIIGLSTVL